MITPSQIPNKQAELLRQEQELQQEITRQQRAECLTRVKAAEFKIDELITRNYDETTRRSIIDASELFDWVCNNHGENVAHALSQVYSEHWHVDYDTIQPANVIYARFIFTAKELP